MMTKGPVRAASATIQTSPLLALVALASLGAPIGCMPALSQGGSDAGGEAEASDAGRYVGLDAGNDAGNDAGIDATDAASDAMPDAACEGGMHDRPGVLRRSMRRSQLRYQQLRSLRTNVCGRRRVHPGRVPMPTGPSGLPRRVHRHPDGPGPLRRL